MVVVVVCIAGWLEWIRQRLFTVGLDHVLWRRSIARHWLATAWPRSPSAIDLISSRPPCLDGHVRHVVVAVVLVLWYAIVHAQVMGSVLLICVNANVDRRHDTNQHTDAKS